MKHHEQPERGPIQSTPRRIPHPISTRNRLRRPHRNRPDNRFLPTEPMNETPKPAPTPPDPATGLEPVACGDYWCLRPGKVPALCMIREVFDETPSGEPLPKLAIRFLASGADFYLERWRELYAKDARFVPVQLPNTNQIGGGQ